MLSTFDFLPIKQSKLGLLDLPDLHNEDDTLKVYSPSNDKFQKYDKPLFIATGEKEKEGDLSFAANVVFKERQFCARTTKLVIMELTPTKTSVLKMQCKHLRTKLREEHDDNDTLIQLAGILFEQKDYVSCSIIVRRCFRVGYSSGRLQLLLGRCYLQRWILDNRRDRDDLLVALRHYKKALRDATVVSATSPNPLLHMELAAIQRPLCTCVLSQSNSRRWMCLLLS